METYIHKKNSCMTISALLIFVLLFQLFFSSFNLNGVSYAEAHSTFGTKEVLVFIGSAIIGGIIYDGIKWVVSWGLSALTPYGIAVVLGTATILGLGALAIYMKNKDDLDYGIREDGCRVVDSRGNMICPARSPELIS